MNDHQSKRLEQILQRLADIAIECENVKLRRAADEIWDLCKMLERMDGIEITKHKPE